MEKAFCRWKTPLHLMLTGNLRSYASKMLYSSAPYSPWSFVLALLVFALLPVLARGGTISLPPQAHQALDAIYSGDPDAAFRIGLGIQRQKPDHPLGYFIQAEALWWERYGGACEIRFGMIEAWKRNKEPQDQAYLELTAKEIDSAARLLAKSETAEMHVYAGMGYDLQARIYAIRGENRNVARVAVKGRAEMLRALELDPQMADASAVLGIYNYYADTLSPIVKLLRIFMGIPGGSKSDGVNQLEVGMNQGTLMAIDARFILARALREYDHKYDEALTVAMPLGVRYAQNPIFQLLLGNLHQELGHARSASAYFYAAQQLTVPNSVCNARIREITNSFLASTRQE